MNGLPPPPPSYGSPSPYGAPYAGAYGGYGASRPVQPLHGLSLATSILLGITALLSLVTAGAFGNRAGVVDDFANSPRLDRLDEVDDADALVAGASLVWLLALVATAAVFIVWQYRHAKNAEAIAGRGGLGPAWAIAGWFIPCANFVLPAIEMWQSSRPSDPALPPGAPPRQGRGSGLVIAWAIVFALGNVLVGAGRAAFPTDSELSFDPDGADEAVTADNLTAGGYVVLAVAAVLAIVMMRSLSKRQAARAAALPSGGSFGYGQPAPPGAGYGGPGYPGASPPGAPGGPAYPGPGAYPPPPAPGGQSGWGPPGQQGPGAGWPPPPGTPGTG